MRSLAAPDAALCLVCGRAFNHTDPPAAAISAALWHQYHTGHPVTIHSLPEYHDDTQHKHNLTRLHRTYLRLAFPPGTHPQHTPGVHVI